MTAHSGKDGLRPSGVSVHVASGGVVQDLLDAWDAARVKDAPEDTVPTLRGAIQVAASAQNDAMFGCSRRMVMAFAHLASEWMAPKDERRRIVLRDLVDEVASEIRTQRRMVFGAVS